MQPSFFRVIPGAPDYPATYLRRVPEAAPVLGCVGNRDLLHLPLLAVVCSSDCPADLVLPSLDLMLGLREAATPVGGGFQAPLEKEWLRILLRGRQPVVIAPARTVEGMEISGTLLDRVAAGSALVLSPFGERYRRPSVELGMRRNELLLSIADRVLVVSAGAGSRALRGAAGALEAGKSVFCFDHARNRDLLLLGAWPIEPPSRRQRLDPVLAIPAARACR